MQLGPLYRAIFRGTPFLAGLLVSLVGAAVLIGWQLGNPVLTQIRPWLPAMRPLVAVGLMFCGVGLIARQRSWRGIAKLCAIAVLLVASSTLPQFIWSGESASTADVTGADSTVVASAPPDDARSPAEGETTVAESPPTDPDAPPELAAVDSMTTETGDLVAVAPDSGAAAADSGVADAEATPEVLVLSEAPETEAGAEGLSDAPDAIASLDTTGTTQDAAGPTDGALTEAIDSTVTDPEVAVADPTPPPSDPPPPVEDDPVVDDTIDPDLAEIVELPDEPVEVAEDRVPLDNRPDGPVAPNTVMALTLAACSILVVRRSVYFGALLAVGVLTLGAVALLGYAADVTQAFGWGGGAQMSVHSALAFAVFGVGLIVHAFEREAGLRAERSWWRPILVGTSAAVVGVLFWSGLRAQERDTIHRMVDATARGLRNEMITSTGSVILAMTRLAEHGKDVGWDSPEDWQIDARLGIGAFRGFERIEWIDDEFVPRIVTTTRDEPLELAQTHQNEIRRQRALLASRETSEPVVVGPFLTVDDLAAFRVIIPLESESHPEAYLSGLFSANRAFSGLSRHLTPGYSVVVLCQGREVFRDGQLDLTRPPAWTNRLPLELPGAVDWEIAIAPEPELLAALATPLPGLAIGSALLIALLLMLTFRFADVAALRAATLEDAVRDRTRELEESMSNLQIEVQERRRTEDILRRTQTLGRLVSAELDPRKLVQAVTDAATELTGADAGCLVYTLRVGSDEAETQREISGPLGPEFGAGGNPPERFRSVLAQPVVSRSGQAQGTLRVAHSSEAHFRARDEEIVAALAAQAAIALDNAMLYEAERRASASLKETSEAKDNFIHLLGHELRNPLGSIRTALKVLTAPVRQLRQTPPPEESDDARRMKRIIDRQVDQLARLVDDLLEVSQLSSDKLTLRPELMDLNELVLDSVESVRPRFESTGLKLAAQIPTEPVTVEADPHRMRQILANLLTNARKFTDAGGNVNVRLLPDPRTGEATISVQDTGCGIDPSDLARVFEPFVQTELARDRMMGGLGLGLPIVKGLTEAHGGRVEVLSDGHGLGCDFRIVLPLATETVPTVAPVLETSASTPRRVLVVDDHRDSADALRRLLELFGNEVAVAYDGPDGLVAAREFSPDVLVCDIGLPGMDGFEVARQIRSDPEMQSITLIALTGFGDEDTIRAAREAGFRRHLTKPVDTERLAQLLAEFGPAKTPNA